jgi:hypothetical protein
MLEITPEGRRWMDTGSSRNTRWKSRRQRKRYAEHTAVSEGDQPNAPSDDLPLLT